ncbi:DNA-binding IclR family transcriptional regulator [Micromonospora profundi]|uniref:IclR family transcriptional regulator n=1 Tax=Micromonospora profundi TaxID=1420889 RepID=UPI00143C288A|nr:IclR family transcriptional regulator [Micromonospora profundi]NJC12966.1 DNA-binding IclR family transcriptional regulator [Micromonospora profundi]
MYGSSTVDKAVDVLMAVAQARNGITNSDLSERLGLDRSTAHRLVSTLERRGLVQRTSERRYVLGSELYFLAFRGMLDHWAVIKQTLADLVAMTGESASFSVLHGLQYYCALQHNSPNDLSYCPTAGECYPLNAGATGFTLLAFQPEPRREQLLAELPLERFTERTITDRDELREELLRTVKRGHALSAGARTLGGCAVACPVFTREGVLMGAVVLSAVEARLPLPKLEDFVPDLKAAAARISSELAGAK